MRRFRRVLLIVAIVLAIIVIAGFGYADSLAKAADKIIIAPLDLAGVADGTYEGSAAIMHVKPQVSVTVANGRITSVSYAPPVGPGLVGMADRIVAAQSLDVDGISGATITTKAVKAAISNAVTP